MQDGVLMKISADMLVETPCPLRPVRRTSVEYRELVDSVKQKGVLQPLLVRPVGDKFEVVDGSHRFSAGIECSLAVFPCLVKEMTDDEVLSIQLQMNAIRPTTQKSEFADRLHELIDAKQLTLPQLSKMVNKSVSWLRDILSLRRLNAEARDMVNRGEIPVRQASMLARLPPKLQAQYNMLAVTMPADEFIETCRVVLKNFREMVREGRTEFTMLRQYEPVPYLRQMREIRHEALTSENAGVIIELMGASTPVDGWRACLAWLLHLDPVSIKDQFDNKERVQYERLSAPERRKKDRELKSLLITLQGKEHNE